jgi:hypothetical protein
MRLARYVLSREGLLVPAHCLPGPHCGRASEEDFGPQIGFEGAFRPHEPTVFR